MPARSARWCTPSSTGGWMRSSGMSQSIPPSLCPQIDLRKRDKPQTIGVNSQRQIKPAGMGQALFVAQRLERLKVGRPVGRVQAEEQPDGGRKDGGQQNRVQTRSEE